MSVKLLTEHHFEFLSLKGAAQIRKSLHMSKCHIVGNLMSWVIFFFCFVQFQVVSVMSSHTPFIYPMTERVISCRVSEFAQARKVLEIRGLS